MAEPSVRVSGTVLASLLFQHVNGDSDVEGLILGESRLDEHVTISDSQAHQIHVQETYYVQKHVAFQRLNMLYSSSGQVNMEELQKLLVDNKHGSVIGWYRQRRNSPQQMSFREKLIHEDLQRALCHPQLVFMLLVANQATPTGSTHKMEYCAFISCGSFLNVPVLVANLGQLEQQVYWKASAPCSATGYSLAMEKHGSRFFCSDGQLKDVKEVTSMNQTLQEELQRACVGVDASERLVETLQAEVSSLSRKLRVRRAAPEAEGVSAVDVRINAPLQHAVAALFGRSPLLLTRTLTLQALPVPHDGVCTGTQTNSGQDSRLSATICRKRPRGTAAGGGDRKCRRRRQEVQEEEQVLLGGGVLWSVQGC